MEIVGFDLFVIFLTMLNLLRIKTKFYEIAVILSSVEIFFRAIALFIQKLHALKETMVCHIFDVTFNHLE